MNQQLHYNSYRILWYKSVHKLLKIDLFFSEGAGGAGIAGAGGAFPGAGGVCKS